MIDKLRQQTRFGSRFNLSLPGRINIAKTFMYSQLTYLGCILPINNTACAGLSKIIEDFVNGPLRISRKRLFQKRSDGGIELIEIQDFLNSQNCVWVKRAENLDDNWKLRLYRGTYGNLYNLRAKNFCKNTVPIIHNIAKNFESFFYLHCKIRENYKHGYLYDNPVFPFEGGGRAHLDDAFLPASFMEQHGQKIRNLQIKHFINERGEPVQYDNFCNTMDMVIPERKFTILSRTCINAYTRLKKEDDRDKKDESIEETCKKGKNLVN
jgi:hypothetical protein